jgi:hypothetical protein
MGRGGPENGSKIFSDFFAGDFPPFCERRFDLSRARKKGGPRPPFEDKWFFRQRKVITLP